MKPVILIQFILLLLSSCNNRTNNQSQAQESNPFFVNKTFSAEVNSICEETSEYNPCAGKQVYLILSFDKKIVKITEKYISSCGKESIASELIYQWKVNENNEIEIKSNSEDIEYRELKNFTFKIENGEIIGYKKHSNGRESKIEFRMMKPNSDGQHKNDSEQQKNDDGQ